MYCVNCGKQIEDNSQNCIYCGAQQITAENYQSYGTTGSTKSDAVEFKPYPLMKALKKWRYPFGRVEVEATGPFKDSIGAKQEEASYNLTFLLLHGIFMMMWYSVVLGCYCYYIMGYAVYWAFKKIKSSINK